MAIKLTSRYNYSKVDYFRKTDKTSATPIVFYSSDDLSQASFLYHTYAGESLHQLSWRYYNRPDLWWAIVEYNPEITDFFNIRPGRKIRVPVV
jgi:nucleoid-associated protein YgaU